MLQRKKLNPLTVLALAMLAVFWPLASHADVTELGNEKLEKLRAAGVAIIDVRRVDEWEKTGMLEGSHGITFFDAKGSYDAEAWLDKLGKIVQADQPVVLICASGVRSSKIAEYLDSRLGFADVSNVTRGIYGWLSEKRPVVEWNP